MTATVQPFVGLDAFDEETADYFVARDRDARVLASNVLVLPVTVLYGGSGVGKSSLLHAGLPRAIRVLREEDEDDEDGEIAIRYHDKWSDPSATLVWLRDRIKEANAAAEKPLILVLDQFEEYFLYRDSEMFERELARALESRSSRLRVLVSLRDDGLYLLDQLRRALPGLLSNRIELRQLDGHSIRMAVEQPVRLFNERHPSMTPMKVTRDFTDELIRQLHESVPESGQWRRMRASERYIELPYLQLALQCLWDAARSERNSLDLALLNEKGGVADIIRNHVVAVLQDLDVSERYFAALVFHYLVTPSGGKFAYTAADLARNISETERQVQQQPVARLLAKLAGADHRLLRAAAGRYELFHDTLAKPVLEWREEQVRTGSFGVLIDTSSGETYHLGAYGELFGRASASGLSPALASRTVSRNHIVVFKTGSILDPRSRYGTTINATPLLHDKMVPPLRSEDVICLGNTAIMRFRWISDASEMREVPHYAEPDGWGYLIDGAARRVIRLSDPMLELGLDGDGSISVAATGIEHPFAVLHHVDEQSFIEVTSDMLPFVKINRLDAYRNHELTLAAGDWASLYLMGYQPDLPDTLDPDTVHELLRVSMAHVEFAKRGVFRIGRTPFEIAVDANRQ